MITDVSRLLTIGTSDNCYSACCADPRGWNAVNIQERKVALRLLTGHTHDIKCAGHLEKGLHPEKRKETLWIITEILRQFEFDAIAFRGLSGALFAPTVALALNKTLLAVRKGEQNHSCRMVEGDYAALRYVMLDDMVSSGDTVRAMHKEIEREMPWAKCIGLLQYLWLTRDAVLFATEHVRPIDTWIKIGRDAWTVI